MRSARSKTKPCQYLCLKTESGQHRARSWETREAPVAVSPSLGERLTLNFGESPNAAAAVSLSSILQANVPERYFLTSRACEGILRRAASRGKKLPDVLRIALETQSAANRARHPA